MVFLKKKEILNNFGFTLMELLVTITIISIMSMVYLVNYRATNQRIVLDQAASGLSADMRLAQNMAMNVRKFNGVIPAGGYGIKIGSLPATSYIVFADTDANKGYSDSTEKFSERFLTSGVSITDISFSGNIDFEPPLPTIWIDGVQTAATASITIRYGLTGSTRVITINRLTGQINVTN